MKSRSFISKTNKRRKRVKKNKTTCSDAPWKTNYGAYRHWNDQMIAISAPLKCNLWRIMAIQYEKILPGCCFYVLTSSAPPFGTIFNGYWKWNFGAIVTSGMLKTNYKYTRSSAVNCTKIELTFAKQRQAKGNKYKKIPELW